MPEPFTLEQVAGRIDHTILKAEAAEEDVDRAVEEAARHGFAAVCVNPAFVGRVRDRLADRGPKACTVVDFPLGAGLTTDRVHAAAAAVAHGAQEIDVVAPLAPLMARRVAAVASDLQAVVDAARQQVPGSIVKVIVESAMLAVTGESGLLEAACEAVERSGADFIKTSTGFHPAGGATVEAVRVLDAHRGPLRVKAAGGIRSWSDAVAMIEAGADRLGCSAGVAIVKGVSSDADY